MESGHVSRQMDALCFYHGLPYGACVGEGTTKSEETLRRLQVNFDLSVFRCDLTFESILTFHEDYMKGLDEQN